MTPVKPFTVAVKGIGRRDYSRAVEFASQATMKGHQVRSNYAYDFYDVPTVPYPYAYSFLLDWFNAEGEIVTPAPDIPYHIYKLILTTGRKALAIVGLYRFLSEDDFWIGLIDKWYGDIYGYNAAELVYTNGIKTEEGKVYAVALAEYSEQAAFDIHITINTLMERVIYG